MATILEGLNKLSGALGGAETATENLEALNAIAGALGGETTATNNADAIDQIAEHATGGGGGGSVELADVLIENTSSATASVMAYEVADGKLKNTSVEVGGSRTVPVHVPFIGGTGGEAAGLIKISFSSDGVARSKTITGTNTGLLQTYATSDSKGFIVDFQQRWLPSDTVKITISNAN